MVVQPLLLVCGKQNGLCIHTDLRSLPKDYMLFWTHTVNSAPASTNSWANWQTISEIKGRVHRSKWARNGSTEIPAAAPTPQAYSRHCTRAHLLCKGQDLNKIFTPEKNKLRNKDWTWIGIEPDLEILKKKQKRSFNSYFWRLRWSEPQPLMYRDATRFQ